jgi:hypothetical protein
MKSKLTPITLIITALLIVLSYLAYTNYIVPFYENNRQFTKNVDLSSDKSLILVADKKQKNINGLEFEISGTSTNNVSLLVYDSSKQNIQSITIKKGEIDHVNMLNWASDTCFLDVSTPENTKGKLAIKYRFVSLK